MPKWIRSITLADMLVKNPCPPDEPGAPCINDWIFDFAKECWRAAIDRRKADEAITNAVLTTAPKRGLKSHDEVTRRATIWPEQFKWRPVPKVENPYRFAVELKLRTREVRGWEGKALPP
jgi:hypothetical protein